MANRSALFHLLAWQTRAHMQRLAEQQAEADAAQVEPAGGTSPAEPAKRRPGRPRKVAA